MNNHCKCQMPKKKKTSSQSEKQVNLLELDVKRFVSTLIKVKSKLIELQPDNANLIYNLCSTSLVTYLLLKKKRKSFTVVLAPKSNLTIWKDNANHCEKSFLITNWLQTVALASTLNVKVCKPFWNRQCQELSKKLWLPTKIDSAYSVLNLSNSFAISTTQNSLYLTTRNIVLQNKNLQKTSCQLSQSLLVSKWVKESTLQKTKRIRLYPTYNQRQIIKQWFGTYRFVYNKCIVSIKQDVRNKFQLKNKHVTAKDNATILEWEKQVPKAIRQQAAYDAAKAYTTCISQLKSGLIHSFDMKFKSKRQLKTSIGIENTTSLKYKDGFVTLFPQFLSKVKIGKRQKKELKDFVIKSDCRMSFDGYNLWLCVPCETKAKSIKTQDNIIALDPGTRTFQTGYDPSGKIVEMNRTDGILNALKKRIALMQKPTSKKVDQRQRY